MLKQERLAEWLSRTLGGHGRLRGLFTALALLALAGVAGLLLAHRARQIPQEFLDSQLVTQLFPAAQQGTVAELLGDSGRSALLVAYIDAMGQAIEQLEDPGQWNLQRFLTVSDAADQAGASIQGFSWRPEEEALEVHCQGGDAQMMQESLDDSSLFLWVRLAKGFQEDEQTYTILCGFPGSDL